MSEPKNPEPTGGLPLDWSLSSVTETAPTQAASTAAHVPAPDAPAPAVSAPATPVAAPSQPTPVVAPAMMDLNVLGAIGSWQAARTPVPVAPPVFIPTPPRAAEPVAPIPPPPVEAAAPSASPQAAPAAKVAPVVKPEAAPAPQAVQSAPPPVGLLHRVAFWRATTAIAVIAAVAVMVLSSNRPATFEVGVAPIGVVNTPAPIYLAELGAGKLRVTPLAIVAVPATKDLQLWMFLVDSQTPISLGVLPATGGIFTLPQIPTEGARFVISLEPHGGSPAGKIAGDVLYGGTLAKR